VGASNTQITEIAKKFSYNQLRQLAREGRDKFAEGLDITATEEQLNSFFRVFK